MPDGDQPPRPGPRKRPPGRPAGPAQKRTSGGATRPGAPERSAGPASGPPRKKKAPGTKAPAKKAPAKQSPAKQSPAKKAAAPRSSERRGPRPEGGERPPVDRGRPAAKTSAKKSPPKKSPPKKAGAKKAGAKKAAAKQRPVAPTGLPARAPEGTGLRTEGGTRPPSKKAPAKKAAATKAPPRKAPAKQAPPKKAPAKKAPAKAAAPVVHDWAADEDDWDDATAAVPAAELLGGSRSKVVVRGDDLDLDDDLGGVPLAPPSPPAPRPPDLLPDGAPGEPLGPGVHEREDAKPVRVTRSGKVKKLRGKHKRIYKAQKKPASRLLNHYDVNGPRIRLGFLWFLLVGFGIGAETATDLPFLAGIYGVAAGFAGWQAAREWGKTTDGAPVRWASAGIGLAIGLAGAASPGAVGLVALAGIVVAAGAAVVDPDAREAVPGNFALTLQCGLFPGIAAASIALTWRIEPGAAIALFVLVSAYEVGDYVVGSGSLNAFEGPIAGILAVGAVILPLYAVQLPPINPDTVITYGVIVAAGCPLGQIIGSAVLPWSDAPAPALRRLDSLILTGPAWLVALYLEQGVI